MKLMIKAVGSMAVGAVAALTAVLISEQANEELPLLSGQQLAVG